MSRTIDQLSDRELSAWIANVKEPLDPMKQTFARHVGRPRDVQNQQHMELQRAGFFYDAQMGWWRSPQDFWFKHDMEGWTAKDLVNIPAHSWWIIQALLEYPWDLHIDHGVTGVDVKVYRRDREENRVYRHDDVWPNKLGRALAEALAMTLGWEEPS